MLTLAQLVAAGAHPTQARQFLEPLNDACARFDITTPGRRAAFIAQCMVESQGFTRTEENCRWRTPERIVQFFPSRVHDLRAAMALVNRPQEFANVVYAGKNGNGGITTGDGWRYRGRGLIQLTGRDNYADAATALAAPYLENPDIVALPHHACLTAAWYWHANKLNLLADAALIDQITRRVNGPAMAHADLRKQAFEEAVRVFA